MVRTWIYIFAAFLCIVAAACSDDVAQAHEDSSSSDAISIIEESSSSEIPISAFSRSTKVPIFFSNQVEISSSSSIKVKYSSSKAKQSSSSSKPASSSVISSSSESSSSVASSSSNTPKSSAALRFYDCDIYDCVTTEFLNPDVSYGELLDSRDNRVYRTIVISNHVWTAQNMIFSVSTDSASASWCYNNNPQNCEKYGRLYTWQAAQKVCPEGWHLPTSEEWKELLTDNACDEELLDDGTWAYDCVGNKLKSTSTWNEDIEKENALGFSVIGAGVIFDKTSVALNEAAFLWSATDTLSFYAFAALLQESENTILYGATDKETGLSVRCVKGYAE
jgi:Fibrobacter succinogenes major domain (Fib_succ_major).